MASRVTLKAVNDELAKAGITSRLERASGYFYFQGGEAADWLDRSVRAEKISSLTVEEWLGEFRRLKKLNAEIMKSARKKNKPA